MIQRKRLEKCLLYCNIQLNAHEVSTGKLAFYEMENDLKNKKHKGLPRLH